MFSLRSALCLLTAAGLLGCHKEHCEPSPTTVTGTGLIGHWKLVQRTCFCEPGPAPDEEVIFTSTSFSFTRDGQLQGSGVYADTTATFCGTGPAVPALRFVYVTTTMNPTPPARMAECTLNGNTLVLDYGSPCDAPRDTYQRVP